MKINKKSIKGVFILTIVLAMTGEVMSQEVRSLSGIGNNQTNPSWGAMNTGVAQITVPDFADGISEPSGADRPNPRFISNQIFAQSGKINDQLTLSDYVWVFGQFIDHDVVLSNGEPSEPLYISIPSGDPDMDPLGTGDVSMLIFRSSYDPNTGTELDNPRRHLNAITSFIDASGVYGVTNERAMWLRSFIGGKLRVSSGNLMPFNTFDGEFNSSSSALAPSMADDVGTNLKLFVGGDVRANENSLLTSFHTLFVREHNRLCTILEKENPSWDDERLYQRARVIVIGLIQSIVYDEWLPAMGVEIPEYSGYDPNIDPAISNVFAAAAFRLGHTLLNSEIVRIDNDGDVIPQGNLALKDAFFNPKEVLLAGGIDPYFKGMGTQIEQDLDCKVIDDVRNFLFGAPGSGGLDLAAINIMRGRERGVASFNQIRRDLGLEPYDQLSQICANPNLAIDIESVYSSVEDVDPWVGMLAEDHMPSALFGETIMYIIKEQFTRLRDGDRFFYENDPVLSDEDIEEIKDTRFSDIIRRNTGIALMQENVFYAKEHDEIPFAQASITRKNLDIALFPNPVLSTMHIKAYSTNVGDADLNIFDVQGRLLFTRNIDFVEGINTLSIEVGNILLPGVYAVQLGMDGVYNTVKIVKL